MAARGPLLAADPVPTLKRNKVSAHTADGNGNGAGRSGIAGRDGLAHRAAVEGIERTMHRAIAGIQRVDVNHGGRNV